MTIGSNTQMNNTEITFINKPNTMLNVIIKHLRIQTFAMLQLRVEREREVFRELIFEFKTVKNIGVTTRSATGCYFHVTGVYITKNVIQ